MKKNQHIIVFGGDQRTVHMIQQFATVGFHVIAIGFEKIQFNHLHVKKEMATTVLFKDATAVILPVGGADEQGKVSAPYATEEMVFTESYVKELPEHAVVYTGVCTRYLKALFTTFNQRFMTLFDRNDVAILNSIPTAEGTLKIAIEHTNRTIHQSSVAIVGFGRIAMTIARLFKAVGAHVTVIARSSEQKARVIEMGCTYLSLDKFTQYAHSYHLCINTVPALVLTKEIIDQLKGDTSIIDVASAPGGVDFQYAKQSGIKTIHALGIPGKTAPITAGYMLADVLIDLLKEQ